MIAFSCPSCGKPLKVKDDLAGKRGACPHCKKAVLVPSAALATAVPAGSRPVDTAQVGGTPSEALSLRQPTPAALPPAEIDRQRLAFLAPPQQPDEIGRLGSYRVLKVIGAGGMGMVLQAEDPMLKRSVALKVMLPELASKEINRQRFIREAQTTAAIEHPNIVHLYQVGEDRGIPFLAMPFLKGEPLDRRLKRENRLPVAEAIRIARQVAEGLAAAHKNGLIHRDIKPANIWLEAETGWVKILDFGLARSIGDDVHLTKSGTILGTPAYMAPEQAGAKPIDHRCDLFSLGTVLYRMLTGELPFQGPDTLSVIMALATENPKSLQELNGAVPQALNDLVLQLLAKDPGQRPESARTVADALAAIEGDRTQVMSGVPVAVPVNEVSLWARISAQVVSWYRLPGWRGWAVKGGTGLVSLLVLVALLSKPGSAPENGQPKNKTQDTGQAVRPPDPVPPVKPPDPRPPIKPPPVGPEKPHPGQEFFTNSVGMKMVFIPPGEFMMGSHPEEKNHQKQEEPQHKVILSRPFLMSTCEVTQGQYEKVMGKNPSFYKMGPNYPMENVSWEEAVAFAEALSQLPAERQARRRYRLPTEAEWEYACRAGTQTPFFFDVFSMPRRANFRLAKGFKIEKVVKMFRPAPEKVGSYSANAWQLHDMHGNVWEWCLDGLRTYHIRQESDPRGPDGPEEKTRVRRGGSWDEDLWHCRSATRGLAGRGERYGDTGFRLVCEALPPKPEPATGRR